MLGALPGSVPPFCSCSTIPVLVGLFKSGAPFCGAISFLFAVVMGLVLGAAQFHFQEEDGNCFRALHFCGFGHYGLCI